MQEILCFIVSFIVVVIGVLEGESADGDLMNGMLQQYSELTQTETDEAT